MTKLKLTLVALAIVGMSQAQSLKFSVGYGIPWISQQIGVNSSTSYSTTIDPITGLEIPRTKNTRENISGSYGSGWNISGAFGYKLSEHIGLDLAISYLAGKEYSVHSDFTDTRLDELKSATQEFESYKSRAILFTPNVKFMTQKRNFTPYFLIGPVFGKINFHRSLDRLSEANGVKQTEFRNTKFSGGISVGFRSAVGLSVVVNKKVSLFTEIVFMGMNYYPHESNITRYTVNGEDRLGSLTANVRKTIYVKKVEVDSGHSNNEDTPNKSPRFPVAMSSISANAGLVINLQ